MRTRKNIYKKNKQLHPLKHFKEQIVMKFLVVLNMTKLYHWKTCNYAAHKASDELYDVLNKNVDQFVEVMLGKLNGERVNLENVKMIPLIDFPSGNHFDDDMKTEINHFKSYLVDLDNEPVLKSMSNSDLFTIRDEILAALNQFLYLLSLK
jgi:hypothetical protein